LYCRIILRVLEEIIVVYSGILRVADFYKPRKTER
jgi:hypothetical protein